MPPKFAYSPAEAAHAAGISRAYVYQLMDAGKLESIKLGSRRLIPVQALADLVGVPPSVVAALFTAPTDQSAAA